MAVSFRHATALQGPEGLRTGRLFGAFLALEFSSGRVGRGATSPNFVPPFCKSMVSTSTVDSVPSIFMSRSARFSPLRSWKIPCRPANGPSNTLTLSPSSTGIGSSSIRPVSGLQRWLIRLITASGNLASRVPKRTMVATPRVERTGPRLCWLGITFRNRYLGNSGSMRSFFAERR